MISRIRKLMAYRSSESYTKYLRNKGVHIGNGTYFFAPSKTYVDVQRPWMLTIGEYCKITGGVYIMQHDYSRSVLRRRYGVVIGESKKTIIGDNVFIGMNAIILMGSSIGNNVIIGAGSVVSGVFPDDTVVAGNPARVIATLDEYYKKRIKCYLEEAFDTFLEFKKHYNREPSIKEMGSFWPLFLKREKNELINNGIFVNLNGDEETEIIEAWLLSEGPIFESYSAFKKEAQKVVMK